MIYNSKVWATTRPKKVYWQYRELDDINKWQTSNVEMEVDGGIEEWEFEGSVQIDVGDGDRPL